MGAGRLTFSGSVPLLRPFQREGVEFLHQHDFTALVADSQGTGKTITTLAAIASDAPRLVPVVVICPASVAIHWKREARIWCPWMRSYIIDDETTPLPRARIDLIVCSWSLLHMRLGDLLARHARLVVGDEIHAAKNANALRTEAFAALAASTPHRILLSGTPLINRESELEQICALLGTQKPAMIRRLLEDVAPDIPPKSRAIVQVALPKRVVQEYRAAELDFASWLQERMGTAYEEGEQGEARVAGEIAGEALIKIGYLRQILANGKVPAAADWIARAVRVGEPVVVFGEHIEMLHKLLRNLRKQRIRAVLIEGATSRAARQEAIDAFQHGALPVLLGSKAAKEGITLTRARNVAFVERFWTAAEEEQAEDRVHRITQRYPTRVWFLHARNTIDDRMAEIVEGKRRLVRDVIGGADIAESDESAVARLLQTWNRHIGVATEGPPTLGADTRLPPLPSPYWTCCLIFSASRWTPETARNWSTMNGYHALRIEPAPGGWRIWNHSATRFRRGTFRSVPLSKDIKAIVGRVG